MDELELRISACNDYGNEKQHTDTVKRVNYRAVNGVHLFSYREDISENAYDTVLIKAEQGKITVIRKGTVDTEMVFEKGCRRKAKYITPAGEIDMETVTKETVISELPEISNRCAGVAHTGSERLSENKALAGDKINSGDDYLHGPCRTSGKNVPGSIYIEYDLYTGGRKLSENRIKIFLSRHDRKKDM